MEPVFQLLINGQSVVQGDFNTIGQYGHIDDYVLAEFLRLAPYNGSVVSKAIMPYGYLGAAGSAATVGPAGANGSVRVRPFRAIVGSRVAAATDALKNWRAIASVPWVGSGTSLTLDVSLAGYSDPTHGRWILVYATVTPDLTSSTVLRKVKDPASKVITSQNVVTTTITSVSIQTLAGTPAVNPVFPTIPSDGGGTYNIPLAYVLITAGFLTTTTLLPTNICLAMPTAQMMHEQSSGPANSMYAGLDAIGGLTATAQGLWGTTATRPDFFLPPDFGKGPTRFLALDLKDPADQTQWSHQNGAILDNSIDWRKRYFKWIVSTGSNASASVFPHTRSVDGAVSLKPSAQYSTADGLNKIVCGMGQSFFKGGFEIGDAFTGPVPIYLDNTICPDFLPATKFAIYCDESTGNLVLQTGNIGAELFIWLDSTTQFSNQ